MMANETGALQSPPLAPPTQPGSLPVPQPEGWPTVIGVIAIVLGALGAIGGLWGLVAPAVMGNVLAAAPAVQRTSLAIMRKWHGWTLTAALLGMGLAILLFTVGIGLLRRQRWSRKAGLIWAGLKMVLVVATSVMGSIIQREMFDFMSRQSTSAPAMSVRAQELMPALTLFAGLLWGWGLPVFLLIWFSRRKIKDGVAAWT